MKKSILVMVFLSVYCTATPVDRGDVGGNSGHHVDCTGDGPVQGGFLLDYLESEFNPNPHIPDLGSDSLSLEDKAMVAIERLAVFDSARAKRYEQHVKSFFSKADKVTTGPDLDFKKDAGVYEIPANCRLRQLVITRPFHPTINPYVYDERLLLSMSRTHQAGTLLHEAVYADTLALGHTNSEAARKFNALISSDDLKGLSQSEYDDFAKKIFEPQFGPEFNSGKMSTNGVVGTEFELNLRSLLSNQGTGKLSWTFLNTLPQWLQYIPEGEMLKGKVPYMAPQDIDIQLVVFDGKKSAIAVLELRLKSPHSKDN